MPQTVLLRGARQLLTLHGPEGVRRASELQNLAIIPDGAVLIRDGQIVAVGTSRRIENLKEAKTALEIDVHGSVVMPAFVDAGLHVGLDRVQDRGTRPKTLRQIYEENLNLMRSCLQHGTLTAEARATAAAPDFHADISILRQLAKIGNTPVSIAPGWKLSHFPYSQDDLLDFESALETITRRQLAHFLEITAGDRPLPSVELLQLITRFKLPAKLAWQGATPELLRTALEFIGPQAVGCSFGLSPQEASVLAEAPVFAVFSPGNQLDAPRGRALRQIVDGGGVLALSSGYDAARSPGFSMQMAVSLAVIHGQLSLEEAITAATVNAAHAVGYGHSVGTLQAGKRADILVLTIPDYREIPRQFGINHVGMVLRQGALVFNRSRWKIGAHEPIVGGVRSQHI